MSVSRAIQDVLGTVDVMGFQDKDGKTYTISPETCECLRELLRSLRNDSHDHAVLRHLGALNIVERDLIPMVKLNLNNKKDSKLYEFLIRLLVTLTYPALIHFKEKLPTIKEEENVYMSLNQYLLNYKVAFSRDVKVWRVFAQNIQKIITKDYAEVEEEEKILLERILVLVRNIVHVPKNDSIDSTMLDDELIVEDLVDCLEESGMFEMLLKLCTDPDYHQFAFHCLEIFYHLLREQSPSYLASNDLSADFQNGNRSSTRGAELLELRDLERQQKKRAFSSSFNRFKDATYVVKNVNSISSRDLILHKTVEDVNKVSLDHGKQSARRAKNRKPMQDDSTFTSAQLGINYRTPGSKTKRKLQDFCSQFISTCYNVLMEYVKSALERNHAQDNDETYYFWAASFFMEFNRTSKAGAKFVEETITVDYFHYLHTILTHHLDMISKEKVEVKAWSRRLHVAVRAYKELIFTIATMKSSADENVLNQANIIRNRMFYEMDYRELLLCLISGYHELKMSRAYLKDLIETNHVFLKMLEAISTSDENFVVRTKGKRKKGKNKEKKKTKSIDDGTAELIWSELIAEITDAVDGNLQLPQPEDDPSVVPYSILSEKSREEQKADVMFRIYKLLRLKKGKQAVALYRYAREAFTEDGDNAFGSTDISPEEEILVLHEIITSDLWKDVVIDEEEESEIINEDQKSGEESDSEQEDRKEQKFDFSGFVHKYACAKVIRPLIHSLKNFETNTSQLNHAIIKMCHRIAMDCQTPVLFYQLSLFRIFQKALQASRYDSKGRYAELVSFSKFIIKGFAKMTSGNDKLLVETLFWKTKKEVQEIEDNYVRPDPKPKKPRKSKKVNGQTNPEDETVRDDVDSELEELENQLEYDSDEKASQKSVEDIDDAKLHEMYANLDDDNDIQDYDDDQPKKVDLNNRTIRRTTIIERLPPDDRSEKSSRKISDDFSDDENITVKRKKTLVLEDLDDDDFDEFSISFSTAQTSTQTREPYIEKETSNFTHPSNILNENIATIHEVEDETLVA